MNKVQYISGTFVDFKGQERNFTMAAVSIASEDSYVESPEDYGMTTPKCVSIGVSVCLPQDRFDGELGKRIAYGKAMKDKSHRLYATAPGMINTGMITGLLEQEAEHFKTDPGSYLRGYNTYKIRYDRAMRIEGYINSLDEQAAAALNYVAQIEDQDLGQFTEAANYLRTE